VRDWWSRRSCQHPNAEKFDASDARPTKTIPRPKTEWCRTAPGSECDAAGQVAGAVTPRGAHCCRAPREMSPWLRARKFRAPRGRTTARSPTTRARYAEIESALISLAGRLSDATRDRSRRSLVLAVRITELQCV